MPFLFTTQRTAWIERALFTWNFYLFLNLLLYILSPKPANRNTQNQCMCKVKNMKIKLIWNVNFILWLFKETIRWFWSPSNALTGSRNWKLHCRVRRCKKWINVHTPRRHWSLSLSMHSFEWRFGFGISVVFVCYEAGFNLNSDRYVGSSLRTASSKINWQLNRMFPPGRAISSHRNMQETGASWH